VGRSCEVYLKTPLLKCRAMARVLKTEL